MIVSYHFLRELWLSYLSKIPQKVEGFGISRFKVWAFIWGSKYKILQQINNMNNNSREVEGCLGTITPPIITNTFSWSMQIFVISVRSLPNFCTNFSTNFYLTKISPSSQIFVIFVQRIFFRIGKEVVRQTLWIFQSFLHFQFFNSQYWLFVSPLIFSTASLKNLKILA